MIILRRHHQKLAPLMMAAADVCRVASPGDITAKLVCNKTYPLINNVSKEYRSLSSAKRHRSDNTNSKPSKNNANANVVKRNINEFSFFGGSNFQHMLQYQNMANQSSPSKPKKNVHPKKQEQLTAVHKQTQSIRHRQHLMNDTHHSMQQPTQAATRIFDNRRDGTKKKAEDTSNLDPALLSLKKIKEDIKTLPKVASSDWVLISNIPPMSKLSDIISGIERIVAFEMDKGVIDLDKIGDYVSSSGVNLKQRRGNLHKVGARESFYATQKIDVASGIPLWKPNLGEELPSHMVLEARLHLSPHARPKGWFLRMPSRSIVHAILNHTKEAEKIEMLERNRMKLEENKVKFERKKWRQGLWKGVWSEYENKLVSDKNKNLLDKENGEERDLAFGVGSNERVNIYDLNAASFDDITRSVDENSGEALSRGEDPHAIAFDYLDEYSQSNHYPEQFMVEADANSSGYRLLRCGSADLKIEEFYPQPHTYRLPSWEQASFQISPILNLSDSVVRIETDALDKSVDDIQYLFRGYDLESVFPEEAPSTSSLPPSCIEYVESLGWKVKGEGNNVDILVSGSAKLNNPRHTFLVRFASASCARMAVRDELKFRQDGDYKLTMTQFPNPML